MFKNWIKPINKGAIINTPYAAIDIIEIPTALSIPLTFPARLYARGTILDIPKPNMLNPITDDRIEL